MKTAQNSICGPGFRCRILAAVILAVCFISGSAGYCIADDEKKFSSYIEMFPQGSIDWDSGMIYGYGKAFTDSYGDRKQALSAARSLASSNIVKLAAGVRLNDELFMQSLGKGRVAIRIEAFVKYRYEQMKLVTGTDRPYYEVIRMTPLKGVEGLTAKLIDHFKTTPVPWMKPPAATAGFDEKDDSLPWLVLDARHLAEKNPVKPAVFPKIVTAGGRQVYTSAHVSEQAVKVRGMARYVTSTLSGRQIQSAWKNDQALLAQVVELFTPARVFAQSPGKTRQRRKLIVKTVEEASGLLNTNLVISARDAEDLQKEDASSKILKECRVIIVAVSPIGGIEGRIDHSLAGL